MMTKSKKIVVCGSEDILSLSIELFLTANQDWMVNNITSEEERDELIFSIKTIQPDIVIIHQDFYKDTANIPYQLLRNCPGIIVIVISLANNMMEIYSKQQVNVNSVSDLISVIESKSS